MNFSDYSCFRFERSGGVLTVFFSRPEQLNLVNAALHTELARWPAEVAADPQTKAVVLTGEGRAFCAGGDMTWFQKMSRHELDLLFVEARKIVINLLELPQPIVAAVNGPAAGLGATVALMCDVVMAAETARFSDPHVRIGVGAGDGGAVIWPLLVGVARAKEYLMTGDSVTAREAERIGLINRVVAADQLLPAAMELAQRFATGPLMAQRATKESINKILRERVNLILDTSLALEKECFHSADHKEAINAFLEKRQPVFVGA